MAEGGGPEGATEDGGEGEGHGSHEEEAIGSEEDGGDGAVAGVEGGTKGWRKESKAKDW